jgi:hypothetical protein
MEDQEVELEHGVEMMFQVEQEMFLLQVLLKEQMEHLVIQQVHQIMDLQEAVDQLVLVVQELQQLVEMEEQAQLI